MFSRRSFFQMSMMGSCLPFFGAGGASLGSAGTAGEMKPIAFKFGMAGFTMCKRSLDDTLAILKASDIHYLCVKNFHLPLNATDATMKTFREKCAEADVTPYAVGPLYTKENDKVRAFFEYAKRLGVNICVGVPYEPTDTKDSWNKRKGSRKQLEYIDTLVKEFDIKYAIHNHGPASPNMYPDVAYGWNLVKDLDTRIGFCMDVGWEYGCGKDPVETIREHGERIFDLHFKNFEKGKPNGRAIPLPRGKIDYVRVIKALRDVGYAGVCSLEYEKDFEHNETAVAESVGYFRGIVDALNS